MCVIALASLENDARKVASEEALPLHAVHQRRKVRGEERYKLVRSLRVLPWWQVGGHRAQKAARSAKKARAAANPLSNKQRPVHASALQYENPRRHVASKPLPRGSTPAALCHVINPSRPLPRQQPLLRGTTPPRQHPSRPLRPRSRAHHCQPTSHRPKSRPHEPTDRKNRPRQKTNTPQAAARERDHTLYPGPCCAELGVAHHDAAHPELLPPMPATHELEFEWPTPKCMAVFFVVAVAASTIADGGRKILKLPLLTGYILSGILCGPYVLQLMKKEDITLLAKFVNDDAMGFIGFSAGAKFLLSELEGSLKPMLTLLGVQFAFVYSFVLGGMWLAAPHLALMAERPPEQVIAISLVIACLGVARSPSSAIALVSELNAHGPFTTTALCITVLMDVVVVLLFAMTLLAVHTILPEPGQEPQPASTVIAIFGLRKSIEPPLSPISRRSVPLNPISRRSVPLNPISRRSVPLNPLRFSRRCAHLTFTLSSHLPSSPFPASHLPSSRLRSCPRPCRRARCVGHLRYLRRPHHSPLHPV